MSPGKLTRLPVLFRVDTAGQFKGDVTAVFPTVPHNDVHAGWYTCYQHIGQHGACSRDWIHRQTRPAREDEYRTLLKELERIGYYLKVCQRMPHGA